MSTTTTGRTSTTVRGVRGIAAAVAVAAALGTAGAQPAAAATPVGVATDFCSTAKAEPRRIDLDCAAGDNMLQRADWNHWGRKAARGEASWCDYCHTDGTRRHVKVRLWRPVKGSHGLDGRVFSRLRVTWTQDGVAHEETRKLRYSSGSTVENGWFWVVAG